MINDGGSAAVAASRKISGDHFCPEVHVCTSPEIQWARVFFGRDVAKQHDVSI